jgi:hypothetical protein
MILVRAAFLGLLVVVACAPAAPPTDEQAAPIIGGRRDLDHPQVALLAFANHLCSGTLVSSRVVLTAAHCVSIGGSLVAPPRVHFGRSRENSETFEAVEVAAHPEYDEGALRNDIGVVVLRERATLEPVPLHLATPEEGGEVTLVGFGLQDAADRGSGGERMFAVEAITNVTSQVIVTGEAICSGDSGGPALRGVDGVEQVAGVISYGDLGCSYGASQRVDIHQGWLAERLAIADPPSCERDFRCVEGCPAGDADCPCAADGLCIVACEDPESDPDCPRGCGAGDLCVAGPECPNPDPDCGDPCGAEGHCLESCPARDPDCPAPLSLGATCTRAFDCPSDATCLAGVCTAVCSGDASCAAGETCSALSLEVSVCRPSAVPAEGGGCAVAPGAGPPWPLLLLVLLLRRRALAGALVLLLAAPAAARPPSAARLSGDAAFAARRYREAARAYQRAVAESELDVDARYRLGVALAAAGDLPGAGRAWESVLGIEPAHDLARRNLELLCRKGVAAPPPRRDELRSAAELLDQGRPASALAVLDRYLEARPVPVREAVALRARARLEIGDAAGALRDARALLASEPHRARGFGLVAAAHRALGEAERARWFDRLHRARAAAEPLARQ